MPRRPILLLLGLLALVGFALWAALNWKPPASAPTFDPANEFLAPSLTPVPIRIRYELWSVIGAATRCEAPFDTIPGSEFLSGNIDITELGTGFRWVTMRKTSDLVCFPGPATAPTNVPTGQIRNSSGVWVNWGVSGTGGSSTTFNRRRTGADEIRNARVTIAGVTQTPYVTTPGVYPPAVQPAEVVPASGAARVPAAPPVTTPQPARVPAAVPGASPVPAPAAVPGGLPGGALAIPTIPQAVNNIRRTIRRSTPGSQPQRITAQGVSTGPTAGPRPTPTGTTFLPGGITLPDQGPRPDLQGIATEVGKLEKKLELLLEPEGPRSLFDQINRVIDQVENIRFVLDALFPEQPYEFGPGQYQLSPVCDRDSEGVLLPPRTAGWTGGQGEVVEVRRKIDALAQLLQHHKDLKQPTCGGPGTGPHSNVTVHFESD